MTFKLRTIYYIIATLWFCACSSEPSSLSHDRLSGIWRLSRIDHFVYPTGIFSEEEREQTFRLYDDTVLYEVTTQKNAEGILFMPKIRVSYGLQEKSDSTAEYLEDGLSYPLTFAGDSAFTFQHMGYRFTYARQPDNVVMRKAVISAFLTDSAGHYPGFLLKQLSEHTLRERYDTLLWVIALGVLLLLGVGWYVLTAIRHKRQTEYKLRQVNEELRQRSSHFVETQRTSKENFEKSDYYIELHRRIKRGDRFSEEDWREMEYQVKNAYPDFVRHLLTLIPLSEVEFRTCMLIRLSVSPSGMADVLHRDLSSISTIRSRLYYKVFGKKGGSHDWDEFVLSL
jgi:hypothetical protein